jgi:L,D-transpeptidase-like protein/putative peptidoglycan binding protein
MERGRHVRSHRRAITVISVVACIVVLGGGGAAYAAYRYDQVNSGRILPGVTVAGVDVSGMTRAEVMRAVGDVAGETLDAPLSVRAAGEAWTVTPAELGERADVDAAVDRAFSVSSSMSLFSRVWHRMREEPVDAAIELEYGTGGGAVRALVNDIADRIGLRARDATAELVEGELRFRHSRIGRELRDGAAARRILGALSEDSASVRLPVKTLHPKVTDEELGPTLVVSTESNQLWFYDGFDLEGTYDVATAAYGYSTPTGEWEIVNKVEDPTWYNPAPDTWGADMPLVIPPGPSNPLGTRALYLNAPGIRIHGTTNVDSIGTHASHGCIRMFMSEVEELYPKVPIGTPVFVM